MISTIGEPALPPCRAPGALAGMAAWPRGRGRGGFTLIELLISIAVIAALAGMLFPALIYVQQRARATEATQAVQQLVSSVELYAAEDPQKRYPYPGPFDDNSNPYGVDATTYFRHAEATRPDAAYAIAYGDQRGATALAGVLALLEAKRLPLPRLKLDNTDTDRRLLDPWRRAYHYRLSLPATVRSAFTFNHRTEHDPLLSDWNWDSALGREALRSGRDPTRARPYPYIYSWGRSGSATDPSTWIYTPDLR